MKILFVGCTGFIGRNLVRHLVKQGHECIVLIRKPNSTIPGYFPAGAVMTPYDTRPDEVDAVINLAGEPVAGSWSETHKKKIMDTRVDSTRELVDWMRTLKTPPKVFLSASAIGFYGDRGTEELSEESRLDPNRAFLAQVCILWEQEANHARDLGVRVVNLRLGNVLGAHGGFLLGLDAMIRLAPVYSPIAPRAYLAWISMVDTVRMMEFALNNDQVRGPLNVVAPGPVTNLEFYRALGKAKHRLVIGSVPNILLRAMLGKFSEAVLSSQKVVPAKAIALGFQFKDSDLSQLLIDLLAKKPKPSK